MNTLLIVVAIGAGAAGILVWLAASPIRLLTAAAAAAMAHPALALGITAAVVAVVVVAAVVVLRRELAPGWLLIARLTGDPAEVRHG
jgi:hypothetical protein